MSLEVGQLLDRKYKIIRLVGQGGMGAVYEGEHTLIGRKVAVKVLHPHAAEKAEVVTRFEREAQAAGRIGNDHILEVLDVGSLPDGSRYLVCEFLDGETLAERLERHGTLSPGDVLPIARQLLTGLQAAHAAGVVHRDLKPDNIFLLHHKAGWTDFVKIIDFGISKFQPLGGDAGGMRMTATGVVMGTPYYLSPEQARGTREADHRSDIYTVGVILYEAVTGSLPFEAANFNDLLFKIVLETPRTPKERLPNLDQKFSDIIMKAMARDPAERFSSASEFVAALEEWAQTAGVALAGPKVTGRASMASASGGDSFVPAAPSAVSGSPTVAAPALTPSSWGGTRPPEVSPIPEPAPKRRSPVLFVALGTLLLAGAGFGLYAAFGSEATQTADGSGAPSGSAPASSPPAPPAEPKPPPEPIDDRPVDEIALGETNSDAGADQDEEDETGRQPARPRPPTVARPAARPTPQRRQARPAPAPAPTPTPTRQRRDLGY